MLVTIEVLAAPNNKEPRKEDLQKNIEALERAKDVVNLKDAVLLESTLSILRGIQQQLPS